MLASSSGGLGTGLARIDNAESLCWWRAALNVGPSWANDMNYSLQAPLLHTLSGEIHAPHMIMHAIDYCGSSNTTQAIGAKH
jgi:hypothetical protein